MIRFGFSTYFLTINWYFSSTSILNVSWFIVVRIALFGCNNFLAYIDKKQINKQILIFSNFVLLFYLFILFDNYRKVI